MRQGDTKIGVLIRGKNGKQKKKSIWPPNALNEKQNKKGPI